MPPFVGWWDAARVFPLERFDSFDDPLFIEGDGGETDIGFGEFLDVFTEFVS